MAQTKMIDVVKMLRLQGHDVQYRKRSDGGILITKIDGQSFKLAEGNTLAREIVGVTLSEARKEQLKEIGKTLYGKVKNKDTNKYELVTLTRAQRKKIPLTNDLKKLLRKAQRIQKKTKVDGKVTTSKVRYQLTHYGEEEAKKKILERIRYFQGYAYEENVRWLIRRLSAINYEYDFAFDEIIAFSERNISYIKDSYIEEINQVIYNLENEEISVDETVEDINNILGM